MLKIIILEYIWIDGNNCSIFSKSRTYYSSGEEVRLDDIPNWTFDGSSTGHSKKDSENSEIILIPRFTCLNPLQPNSQLVLCDTYNSDLTHTDSNHRVHANKIMTAVHNQYPMFGLEQEYYLITPDIREILQQTKCCDKWYKKLFSCKTPCSTEHDRIQAYYSNKIQYCGGGHMHTLGRKIANEHLQACVKAKLTISGINAEVGPNQWEFQIGPIIGIEAGDHMWVARYLLIMIAEKYETSIDFSPKPFLNLPGSGCHVNFSTKLMREYHTGFPHIINAINLLAIDHENHMKIYGYNNNLRLTGKHETASIDDYTYGIGTRTTSIRIGQETFKNKGGYFEDRRPGSNIDPYLVTSAIVGSTVLEKAIELEIDTNNNTQIIDSDDDTPMTLQSNSSCTYSPKE
jgi:glutamine synthetase